MTFESLELKKQPNYEKLFKNGLNVGERILIYGHSDINPELFSLVFATNEVASTEIPLSIKADFKRNLLTRSTLQSGHKPVTERLGGPFPLSAGCGFEIVISVKESVYSIIVNRLNVYFYSHKMPYNLVTNLKAYGDVSIEKVFHSRGLRNSCIELWNHPVPFVQKINMKKNLKNGKTSPAYVFRFLVDIHELANNFEINFQYGSDLRSKFIGLHFNPRWYNSDMVHENQNAKIVLNSRTYNNWGQEMIIDKLVPLRHGHMAEILFEFRKADWLIVIEQNAFSFPHRNAITNIDHVYVNGELDLKLFELADF